MLKFASPKSYCLAECSRWFKLNPAARHQVHPDSANLLYVPREGSDPGRCRQHQEPQAQNSLCRDQRSDLSRTFPKPSGVFPEPLLQMLQLECTLTLHTSAWGFCLGASCPSQGLPSMPARFLYRRRNAKALGNAAKQALHKGLQRKKQACPVSQYTRLLLTGRPFISELPLAKVTARHQVSEVQEDSQDFKCCGVTVVGRRKQ